jgi:dTDP-4-dehydrorhamnose reductase
MSRALITGCNGQMGRAVMHALSQSQHSYQGVDRQSCDITDRTQVFSTLATHRPEFVINCAAMTNVDQCESTPELAVAPNRDGPAFLAEACAHLGIALIHLSTDYVFGQDFGRPFVETDAPAPINHYGASKAQGEAGIIDRLEQHIILRTSWVYSENSSNFFMTMMKLAGTREQLAVVTNEQSCPTYAAELASLIVHILDQKDQSKAHWGVFHACGSQSVSRFGFAQAIMKARQEAGLKVPELVPVSQADFGAPALRPVYSVMDCTKLKAVYGFEFNDMTDIIPELVTEMAARDQAWT